MAFQLQAKLGKRSLEHRHSNKILGTLCVSYEVVTSLFIWRLIGADEGPNSINDRYAEVAPGETHQYIDSQLECVVNNSTRQSYLPDGSRFGDSEVRKVNAI